MTQQEREQWIEKLAKYVKQYAPQFNIKVVSPIVAQGVLESSCGTSPKGLKNNFFGLKYRPGRVTCHNGLFWDGGSEQNPDGSYRPITDQWYSFPDMEMGVLGYFQWTNIAAYSSLKNITDPYQYLVNIKACNYATSHDYVMNVWQKVIDYDLRRFDPVVANKGSDITIAIDAGHGSNTAGKRIPDGYREHWINVACASFCDAALKRCGLNTLRVAWDDLNAKDDEDLALANRQKLIKLNNCLLSVSFHANAYGNGWNDAQGVETLISNKSPGDSLALATKVQSYLIQGTHQKNRGVKTQSLAMCNCGTMGTKAAILVEVGFMTNKAEADLMKTDAFCREQAEEVAHGICDYLGVSYVAPTGSVISEIVNDIKEAPKSSYLVKINTDVLNVRAGAGTQYPKTTQVKRGQVYTIVDELDGWGKLKSGAGWIKLSYTKEV